MGDYTVSLRYLIERGYPLALDKYPIWDEEYRPVLNNKIIEHFYFREIGQETPDRFNFFLRRKMNEIMPYYNKLYESEMIEFDPLASEFFKEGVERSKDRSYKSTSKNHNRHGETTGEIYSANEDGTSDTAFGQTSTENVTGDYRKQGTKNVDTTSTKDEDFTQNVTGEGLTTTNMHTKTVSSSDSNGTKKVSGSQNTTFSDIPQAGIETTRTIAPDGTVTEVTKGYATTTTNVSSVENTATTDHNDTTSNTDNTGTVETETSEKTVNDNITKITQNEKTTWSENGDHTQNTGYKNDTTTGIKTNTKNDSERNVSNNSKTTNNHSERSTTGENETEMFTGKGRKGINPSDMIQKYRDILLNIDMMIIEELETLFMGVY